MESTGVGELDRNLRNLREAEHEVNKIENRMDTRKNMNGYHWDQHKKLIEEKNRLEKAVVDTWKNLD